MVRRLAVEKPASLQQTSGRLHDEAWAGRVGCSSLEISQELEIANVCVVTVSYLLTPDFGTSSPGRGREARSWIGWTHWGKTERSGGWLFWGALQVEVYVRLLLQRETG